MEKNYPTYYMILIYKGILFQIEVVLEGTGFFSILPNTSKYIEGKKYFHITNLC